MDEQQGRHSISFLLRLWQAGKGEDLEWRASLETLDGDRLAFASIDDLCVYLHQQASRPSEQNNQRRVSDEEHACDI